MKLLRLSVIFGIVLVGISIALPQISEAKTVRVKSGVTKRGVYRQSHSRTSPDRSKSNNYGTKGNINPQTGKKGRKKAY